MKIKPKNRIYSILLFMCMLLCLDAYFQQSDNSSLTEVSAADNFAVDLADSDLELNDEEFTIIGFEFLPEVKMITIHNHLHFINRPSSPFLPIWQLPKLDS